MSLVFAVFHCPDLSLRTLQFVSAPHSVFLVHICHYPRPPVGQCSLFYLFMVPDLFAFQLVSAQDSLFYSGLTSSFLPHHLASKRRSLDFFPNPDCPLPISSPAGKRASLGRFLWCLTSIYTL